MKEILKHILPHRLFGAYHYALALCAAFFYRFPAYRLVVIGVTGTNGKSTCVYMINEILKEAGYRTCAASSIDFTIGNHRDPNMLKMTMAGPFVLQKFLRKAVDEGCHFCVLEVTSEGILQNRHSFIPFHTVVLTNMSPEHIERHGGFEAYRAQKAKIFQRVECMVINCDDAQAAYFLQIPAKAKYGYGMHARDAYQKLPEVKELFLVDGMEELDEGFQFIFQGSLVRLFLPGEFNVRNAVEALVVTTIHGVPMEKAKNALEHIHSIPGRMEVVIESPIQVIVDYAHTPVALRSVYETLRKANPKPQTPNPKLICVLGATGGGRDAWKRPEFGKLAATYCDSIILTNEDPYDENPEQIIAEVKAGISQSFSGRCEEILDRRKAISRALAVAKNNDVVIITGKGCEPFLVTKKGKIPWDDRAIVRDEAQRYISRA